MKKGIAVILSLAMVFSMAACGKTVEKTAAEPASTIQISKEDWPVIDGALACVPYYEQMAALLLGTTVDEGRQYVLANNTPDSFTEIAEGAADVIFCLHGSKEQEDYANRQDTALFYTPFALDAFVFFVNKDNPVDSLTMEQLKDIYAGKITNWKEVGGNDEEIVAYQRNEGSGSQTGLYQYVISEEDVMEPPTERRIGSMGGIVDAVASYDNGKGAIGYSYLYFVTNQHYDEQIKLLKIDGAEPTAENIQQRSYPMVTEYCCITSSKSSEAANTIAEWVVSDEGQYLAQYLSYVPLRSVDLK